MNFKALLPLLGVAAISTAACFPTEDSCNIKTPGIYVEFDVTETGNNARAKAVFWTGDDSGGTNLELTCGDTIIVNGVELEKSGSNPIEYSAPVDVADEYDFVFEREDEDPYTSTVANMPEPVVIETPDGEDIARDESFDITWEDNGTGDTLNLVITSDCFWDYPETLGDDVPDSGIHTVAANAFELQSGEEAETCTADVELIREVDGELSADLKGEIVGRTRDTASFTSTPAADAL